MQHSSSIITDPKTREAMRQVLAERGKVADARESRWSDDDRPEINYYGWKDYQADKHLTEANCKLVIPSGVEVQEINFSQFTDTFSPSDEYHGITAYGKSTSAIRCECGKLNDLFVVYMGTFNDLMLATLAKLNNVDIHQNPSKGFIL